MYCTVSHFSFFIFFVRIFLIVSYFFVLKIRNFIDTGSLSDKLAFTTFRLSLGLSNGFKVVVYVGIRLQSSLLSLMLLLQQSYQALFLVVIEHILCVIIGFIMFQWFIVRYVVQKRGFGSFLGFRV